MKSTILALLLALWANTAHAQEKHPTPAERQETAAVAPAGIEITDLTTLSPEARYQLKLAARFVRAKQCAAAKDILGWGKILFPKKFNKPFCDELHGYFVSIRHDELTATEAPRDHSKTTIKCFLIPIFQALEEPGTFTHYLNVQANEEKANAINISIRYEIEENEILRMLYGDQRGSFKWTDGQFALKNGVCFTAAGAGQSIRGKNYLQRRPDYIIVDDLYDFKDIHNPDSTKAKTDWFWSDLYPARSETSRSCVHLQGTAINEVDILATTAGRAGVTHRTFSAVDWKAKKSLWPELRSFEGWEALRGVMPVITFEREYENKRADSAASFVKRAWLTAWEYDPATLKYAQDFQISAEMVLIDPSIGKNNENDPAAYIHMVKTIRAGESIPEYWIENAFADRLTLQGRRDKAKEFTNDRPSGRRISAVRVEAISGFDDFGELIKSDVQAPVELIKKVMDKLAHLETKSYAFQNHRVHLNKNIDPATKEQIVYQLTTNHPTNDDLRDAILHGIDSPPADWSTWL